MQRSPEYPFIVVVVTTPTTTQPQHCGWVERKIDGAQPTHPTIPPQKLNRGLQEPQINIYRPQLDIM